MSFLLFDVEKIVPRGLDNKRKSMEANLSKIRRESCPNTHVLRIYTVRDGAEKKGRKKEEGRGIRRMKGVEGIYQNNHATHMAVHQYTQEEKTTHQPFVVCGRYRCAPVVPRWPPWPSDEDVDCRRLCGRPVKYLGRWEGMFHHWLDGEC